MTTKCEHCGKVHEYLAHVVCLSILKDRVADLERENGELRRSEPTITIAAARAAVERVKASYCGERGQWFAPLYDEIIAALERAAGEGR